MKKIGKGCMFLILLSILFFVAFILYFKSIHESKVLFEIKNTTNHNVIDIKVHLGLNSCQSENIESLLLPDEKVILNIDFLQEKRGCKKLTTDGFYILEYKLKDKKYKDHFGYYTNGYPLDSSFILKIKEDRFDIKDSTPR